MTAKIKRPLRAGSQYRPRNVSRHAFERVYWPYLPLVLLVGVLLALNVRSHGFQSVSASPSAVLTSSSTNNLNAYLTDANSQRSADHEQTLNLNPQLQAAAQTKANDMATRNYWSHDTPEGNVPWVFATAEGYSYQKMGENLAAGFIGPQAVTTAWMNSQPHRANLLDPAYTDAGFGVAYSPNYTSAGGGAMFIVVALFGRPAGAPASSTQPASTSTVVTANSQNSNLDALTSEPTNHVQLAAAFLSPSDLPTVAVIVCLVGALGIWIGRHMVAIRRAAKRGEHFVIKHPVLELGLIAIIILSLLLVRTAGFIQ